PTRSEHSPATSVHIGGRILLEDVPRRDQDVFGRRLRGYALTAEHAQGEREHLIAIEIEVIGNRSKDDAAPVCRIDLLFFSGTPVDATVEPLTDNDAIADAHGTLNRRLRGEGGRVVEGCDQDLAPGLRRQEFAEQSFETNRIATGVESREGNIG